MSKVFVIAEIGINHNGDLNIAKKYYFNFFALLSSLEITFF